jgi:hypothetical protein
MVTAAATVAIGATAIGPIIDPPLIMAVIGPLIMAMATGLFMVAPCYAAPFSIAVGVTVAGVTAELVFAALVSVVVSGVGALGAK